MVTASIEACAEGLLKTDIALIAEDDDYVVFALRVAKRSTQDKAALSAAVGKLVEAPFGSFLGPDRSRAR